MGSQSRIYVGHLDQKTRESDLEKFFKGFGRIREITMKSGFAFVEFEDYRDADDAVHELNGKDLLGSRVLVEFTRGMPRGRFGDHGDRGGDYRGGGGYRGGNDNRSNYNSRSSSYNQRSPRGGGGNSVAARTPHRAVIENLSSSVSWQDLKDFMRQAGEVVFTDVFAKRNEGVVEFASATDLRNAMSKLDGKELNGRKIKLIEEKYHKKSGDRRRSRTRSRTRSRSASKSRSRTPKKRSRSKSRSRSNTRSQSPENDKKPSGDKKSNNGNKKRESSSDAGSGDEGAKKSKRPKSSDKEDSD